MFGFLFSSSESELDFSDIKSRANVDRCLVIMLVVQICESILVIDDGISLQGPLRI